MYYGTYHAYKFADEVGINSLLEQFGLASEVLPAVDWFRKAGADTLRDVIEADLQVDFVESLGFGKDSFFLYLPVPLRSYFGGLPPVKKSKLLRALNALGGTRSRGSKRERPMKQEM
eukprot:2479188-Prymnesium_polylepis.2